MIINYCSGGIGNRLKPMASCFNISQETGREFGIFWPKTLRCSCDFNDLYKNIIKNVDLTEILKSDSVSLYTHRSWVEHDVKINDNMSLLNIANKFGIKNLDSISNIKQDTSKIIIVYSNTYLNGFENNVKQFFNILQLQDEITSKLQQISTNLNINKSVIGVHARGTDFEDGGITVDYYINKMKSYPENSTFFVCSDSKDYQDKIRQTFKNVLSVDDKIFVNKKNSNERWSNNVYTPKDSLIDSMVDLYLLAKTDFKVYNENSSFAQLVHQLY